MAGMQDKRDWQAFSLAESLSEGIDPAWERHKALGNEALKLGNHDRAAEHYRKAHIIALGAVDGGAIAAFVEALESWPRGSAHHKMSELDDVICDQILSRLWVQPQPASFTFPDTFAMDGDRRWTA